MKKVILLALLMPVPAFGQIVENFESESIVNWVQSPEGHWKADTTESISGRVSLHQIFDNPDAGTDRIGIPVKSLHPSEGTSRWTFLVRYGYDPSSLNNWSVFLMSDTNPACMSAEGGTKGYAIGVNLTGSDDSLRLWKVNDTEITPVVTCRLNWQTDIGIASTVKLTVERSQQGNWTVSVSSMTGNLLGTDYGTDNELFGQEWFGIFYRYSSTRDRLLWIDDISIEGIFHEDKEAPLVIKCEPAGRNSAEVTFNEEPSEEIMIPDNISLNDEGSKAMSVVKINNLTYRIGFSAEFKNRSVNNLIIRKLCDKSGNCSLNVTTGFTAVWAEKGDVIISEIMADPLPEVSLPDKEYLELTNTTQYTFNLKDWTLSTETQNSSFPETSIDPAEIVILCSPEDTLVFKNFGRVIGIKQFPSLTDDGRILYISDNTGILIHGVEYSSDWYREDLKSNGGWSLEMIDTGYPFYGKDNWIASGSRKGGTPGSVNSVSESNADNSFYGIRNVFADDSISIRIRFSEPVFDLSENIKNISIGDKKISSLSPNDPLCREYSLKPEDPLDRKELYTLDISGEMFDFAGNIMQKNDFSFGLSERAAQGDILFNEILFNPLPGDPDYLEFYNSSDKVIDVSRLQLVSMNDATGDKSDPVPVSEEERCLLPGEYYAITTDAKKVSERYPSSDPEHLFETGSLPSMPDDNGHLVLYNRELDRIDELMYNDKMHYALLSSHEGVALEKTNPGNKSEETAAWHSATESSGWGTPGAQNSVFSDLPSTTDKVVLSSSKISPDDDGYEDFLTIGMNLQGKGNVVSVMIFDESGNYIRKLASNLYAGSEASVIWDGTADDGSMVRSGIYIVFISLYDDTGKTKQWKKVCTVLRKQ
jgi:hypothetical protein